MTDDFDWLELFGEIELEGERALGEGEPAASRPRSMSYMDAYRAYRFTFAQPANPVWKNEVTLELAVRCSDEETAVWMRHELGMALQHLMLVLEDHVRQGAKAAPMSMAELVEMRRAVR